MTKGLLSGFMQAIKKVRIDIQEEVEKQKKKSNLHIGKVVANDDSYVFTREDSPCDIKISELGKQATVFKDNKDWDSAIACLREINKLSLQSGISYPITHPLRLPLFLQQGGYYDEAMKEFQKILDDVENQIIKGFSRQPKSTQKMLAYTDFSQIYKSMHTANKREKLFDKAEEYKKNI